MFKKLVISTFSVVAGLAFAVLPVSAHVVVKPNEVGAAAYQTFTVGMPNEKDVQVVGLKLLVPDGLKSVSPNVKPGWTVNVKKSGDGEDAKVTEINWTGGLIPAGQRDEFMFSAQAPASETTLIWKAYQTYQDGTVVSWDQAPVASMSDDDREKMEEENLGPYSQTKVTDDLGAGSDSHSHSELVSDSGDLAIWLSTGAILLSAATLAMQLKKKQS